MFFIYLFFGFFIFFLGMVVGGAAVNRQAKWETYGKCKCGQAFQMPTKFVVCKCGTPQEQWTYIKGRYVRGEFEEK